MAWEAPLGRVSATAYKIPTDAPEADGTLEWDSTVLVLVEIEGGGETGLGYTYSDASIVALIERKLAPVIAGHSALDIGGANVALWRSIRNLGRSGLVATAISAIDVALWDLKANFSGRLWPRCSRASAAVCQSTAAAGSPATRTRGCASNSPAGSARWLSLGQNENRQ
jgi:hypothetical protein